MIAGAKKVGGVGPKVEHAVVQEGKIIEEKQAKRKSSKKRRPPVDSMAAAFGLEKIRRGGKRAGTQRPVLPKEASIGIGNQLYPVLVIKKGNTAQATEAVEAGWSFAMVFHGRQIYCRPMDKDHIRWALQTTDAVIVQNE